MGITKKAFCHTLKLATVYSCIRETDEYLEAKKGKVSREQENPEMSKNKRRKTTRGQQRTMDEEGDVDLSGNSQPSSSNGGDGLRNVNSGKPQFIVKKIDVEAAYGVVVHSITAFKCFKVM